MVAEPGARPAGSYQSAGQRQRWSGIGREQMGDRADPADEPLREVH